MLPSLGFVQGTLFLRGRTGYLHTRFSSNIVPRRIKFAADETGEIDLWSKLHVQLISTVGAKTLLAAGRLFLPRLGSSRTANLAQIRSPGRVGKGDEKLTWSRKAARGMQT
jgi:hypothetical protein